MLLLGIDLGTSSIKLSVVDPATRAIVASASYPEKEVEIIALQPGWAEQDPNEWWDNVQQAILKCHATKKYDPADIGAIGIAYQMHGLVLTGSEGEVLRNAIIWCDSRAVDIGNKAFKGIGEKKCLTHLLNSPGNFTAAKLAWVKANEPDVYAKIHKILLPGDFIASRFTGDYSTTVSALSEGVFWDFKKEELSADVMNYFGFDASVIPAIKPLFSVHGEVRSDVAARLQLKPGIPVSYKSGDQPNNALALNVLEPGEVAATAGTSGVIYGVSSELHYDEESRINSFAHVNHAAEMKRIGILLCINGTGIFNRWIKNITGSNKSYDELNEEAVLVPAGADGLLALPFGNGAERMLNNRIVGGQFHHLDFNKHSTAHMIRAVQEGIAFSFRYGLDIMRNNGIEPKVIRAARTNLFLSGVFTDAFTSVNDVALEFYDGDGSFGAALGAGIGAGIYSSAKQAAETRKPLHRVEPGNVTKYNERYLEWKEILTTRIQG